VQRPEFAFGASRDGARDVERGARRRPSGKDEGRQGRMGRVPSVDLAFQAGDVPRFDAVLGWSTTGSDRELGLGDEQLVLQPADQRTEVPEARGEARLDLAEVGPELVEGAVRADARRVLVYARTMGETGRSAVARTGIETRDALASGRQGNWSNGELRPWTGQNEMCSTSLCLAS
jgi:hypothetical protein